MARPNGNPYHDVRTGRFTTKAALMNQLGGVLGGAMQKPARQWKGSPMPTRPRLSAGTKRVIRGLEAGSSSAARSRHAKKSR
jgi:hypothetical protein